MMVGEFLVMFYVGGRLMLVVGLDRYYCWL